MDTAKIEKILIAACIPQKAATITAYLAITPDGKRNITPAGMIQTPITASTYDNLPDLYFPVRSPVAILPKIVATAIALSAPP